LLDDKAADISFSSLRAAIRELQAASLKLDDEKTAAKEDFERFVRIIFPGRQFLRSIKRRTGFLRIVADKIKQVFGILPPTNDELHMLSLRHAESWEEFLEFAASVDEKSLQYEKTLASLPFPFSKFVKAAKRIVAANRKLILFERGFISEGGIKDREWYRHLGVAPGKWLGKLD
jgi:N-acetylated-alpha-linked acidic dipeptidase